MPCWTRIAIATLLMLISAPPLVAQGLSPWEPIYCPTAEEERARQCRQAEATLRRTQDMIVAVGGQMRDPGVFLVRVERAPGESLSQYRTRVTRQQGVASAESNRWLPVLGRYYDPDRRVVYVALHRQDYWRYIWEKLAPDLELARRTFRQRERESRRFKAVRYTGTGGQLARWEQEVESTLRFQEACCRFLTESAPLRAPIPSGNQPRP